MEFKTTKTYQFLLKDFNDKLKPFRFYNGAVYYVSNNGSNFNYNYVSPYFGYSNQLIQRLRNKGYDFVYLSGSNLVNNEDLSSVYQFYTPAGKLSFPDNSSGKFQKSNYFNFLSKKIYSFFKTPDKTQNKRINYVDLLLQFLGIEEKSKDIFIYADRTNLYVILVREMINPKTNNIIEEVIDAVPDKSQDFSLYSPISYNPEEDEDYFSLDEETRKSVKDIIEKLSQFNESGQFLAILPFMEKQINIIKSQEETEISSLYIDENYRIFLKEYANKEVKMSHLTKSLYFLFLIKSDIDLVEIFRLENELLVIYKHISNQESLDKMKESVSQLLKNENNELYVHFSRIKSAFCKLIDQDIAKHYYIKGAKNKPKGIELDRKLSNIIDLHNIWFPNRIIFTPEITDSLKEFFGNPVYNPNAKDKEGDLPF